MMRNAANAFLLSLIVLLGGAVLGVGLQIGYFIGVRALVSAGLLH